MPYMTAVGRRMVTDPGGSSTASPCKAWIQILATLQGFEQVTGSFMFQILEYNHDITMC